MDAKTDHDELCPVSESICQHQDTAAALLVAAVAPSAEVLLTVACVAVAVVAS